MPTRKPAGTLLCALLSALLLVSNAGCFGAKQAPPPGSPTGQSANPPPTPAAPAAQAPRRPWFITVSESREANGSGLAGPEFDVVSGQTILVGQGDVCVNLHLFKGASFEAIKPYLEAEPAAFSVNTADMESFFAVQIRWNANSPEQMADKMSFRLKRGAPVGGEVTVPEDFVVTVERRTEPHYVVVDLADPRVHIPYRRPRTHYAVLPGKHTFRMTFNKDMDHASVEQVVRNQLTLGSESAPAPALALEWSGARTLDISLDLPDSPCTYRFSANGARDAEGMPVWFNDELYVEPKQPIRVVALTPGAPAAPARELMSLLGLDQLLAISGDGTAVFGLESPSGAESQVDDGIGVSIPWLCRIGSEPVDLTEQLGLVLRGGLRADGGAWGISKGVAYAGVTSTGRLTAKKDCPAAFPAGWAVSGDGMTAVYFLRSPGSEDMHWEGTVDLNLYVYNAGSDETRRFDKFTKMPASADFYGPALTMLVDQAGNTLVYADQADSNARLLRVDLGTGRSSPIAAPPEWLPTTISPDGKRVVGACPGGLNVIDLETGHLTKLSAPTAETPVFSPDGRCLAFRVWETKGGKQICRVKVIDLASPERSVDLGEGWPIGWSGDGLELFIAKIGGGS